MRWAVKAVLLALCLAGCAGRAALGTEERPRIDSALGTIRRVGDFGYAIVPDSDPGTRYAPDRLPAELQVDGVRVVFSGAVQAPPPNTRVWALPLRLTAIRRADVDAP